MDEIKRLCLEQLELLSEKKLLKILEGMNETSKCHCTPENSLLLNWIFHSLSSYFMKTYMH